MPMRQNKEWCTGQDDDFPSSCRGYIGALSQALIHALDGGVIGDSEGCPATASPSLWRQPQLTATQGLFEVVPDAIYQVRGLDLANMTLVEGSAGVIVIDPLISSECAAAALALYRSHRGERPVTMVIYSHSDVRHFGGVRGVTSGDVPIIAPTLHITATGQEETVDGVRMVFQLTPAEMNIFLPSMAALGLAGDATHTLRGALVRARHLTEAISMFADRSDVVFASHRWPTWGRDRVLAFLSGQRDVHAYLHDQTMRLIGKGHTGAEIAQMLTPPGSFSQPIPRARKPLSFRPRR